ncbi:MAG: CDP-alcohol phosphatidyltransferase family protein [Gemmataceae bacterium]
MFDGSIRRAIDPPLDRIAAVLARAGVRANAVTIIGFLIGVGGWGALAVTTYWMALGFILVSRLADGLDGAIARRTEATDLGGYLDIVLDFLFYSGVPFFFALGRPEAALPAAFLVFSFVGTGSTFLALASVAARGLTTEARGRKTIYYLGGLTEGAETIALFVAICLFPDWFAVLAWTFGGLCWVTTAGRIAAAVATFRDRPLPPGRDRRMNRPLDRRRFLDDYSPPGALALGCGRKQPACSPVESYEYLFTRADTRRRCARCSSRASRRRPGRTSPSTPAGGTASPS